MGERQLYQRSTDEDAQRFLIDLLSRGVIPVKEARARSREAGHSRRVIAEAKRKLGVRLVRQGGLGAEGAWLLGLPIPTTTAPAIPTAIPTTPEKGVVKIEEVAEIEGPIDDRLVAHGGPGDPISAIIGECAKLGVLLKVVNGRITLDGPGALPYGLLGRIVSCSAELEERLGPRA